MLRNERCGDGSRRNRATKARPDLTGYLREAEVILFATLKQNKMCKAKHKIELG